MNHSNSNNFLTQNISTLTGVGAKTQKILKKKKLKKY